MRYTFAILYFMLCATTLILELTIIPFHNGLEAGFYIGTSIIGIYLAWFALTANVKGK